MANIIHRFAVEYGWTKNQIDEVYPEESILLLQEINSDHVMKIKSDRIEVLQTYINTLRIHHSTELNEIAGNWIGELAELVGNETNNSPQKSNYNPPVDDDLPDFATLRRLREMKKGGS